MNGEEPAREVAGERWRRPARWTGWLLVLISTVWVLQPILTNARELGTRIAAGPLAATTVASTAIYGALSISLMGTAWWWLTGVYGTRSQARPALAVWARTWVAKYLPGNVGHYVGRQLLAADIGQRQVVVAAASTLETVGMLGVGAAIVLVGLDGRLASLTDAPGGNLMTSSLLVLAILGALLAWPLLDFMLRRIPWIQESMARLPKLSGRRLITNLGPALALYGLTFVVLGTVLWALIDAGFPSTASRIGWGQTVWVSTVAWAVGLVVVGAPAGLGVREATITLLLADAMGQGDAATAAVAFRLVTLLGDLATAGIGWWLGRPPR